MLCRGNEPCDCVETSRPVPFPTGNDACGGGDCAGRAGDLHRDRGLGAEFHAALPAANRNCRWSDTLLADIGSKGLLIDQHELQLAMDALVEQLHQPAWQAEDILQITADPDRRCSYNPVVSWGLMGKTLLLPPRYRICLRASSLTEPVDVVSNGIVTQSAADQLEDGAPPGIYILQALPDQLDASTLPARRIFCRPRPYC